MQQEPAVQSSAAHAHGGTVCDVKKSRGNGKTSTASTGINVTKIYLRYFLAPVTHSHTVSASRILDFAFTSHILVSASLILA